MHGTESEGEGPPRETGRRQGRFRKKIPSRESCIPKRMILVKSWNLRFFSGYIVITGTSNIQKRGRYEQTFYVKTIIFGLLEELM